MSKYYVAIDEWHLFRRVDYMHMQMMNTDQWWIVEADSHFVDDVYRCLTSNKFGSKLGHVLDYSKQMKYD